MKFLPFLKAKKKERDNRPGVPPGYIISTPTLIHTERRNEPLFEQVPSRLSPIAQSPASSAPSSPLPEPSNVYKPTIGNVNTFPSNNTSPKKETPPLPPKDYPSAKITPNFNTNTNTNNPQANVIVNSISTGNITQLKTTLEKTNSMPNSISTSIANSIPYSTHSNSVTNSNPNSVTNSNSNPNSNPNSIHTTSIHTNSISNSIPSPIPNSIPSPIPNSKTTSSRSSNVSNQNATTTNNIEVQKPSTNVDTYFENSGAASIQTIESENVTLPLPIPNSAPYIYTTPVKKNKNSPDSKSNNSLSSKSISNKDTNTTPSTGGSNNSSGGSWKPLKNHFLSSSSSGQHTPLSIFSSSSSPLSNKSNKSKKSKKSKNSNSSKQSSISTSISNPNLNSSSTPPSASSYAKRLKNYRLSLNMGDKEGNYSSMFGNNNNDEESSWVAELDGVINRINDEDVEDIMDHHHYQRRKQMLATTDSGNMQLPGQLYENKNQVQEQTNNPIQNEISNQVNSQGNSPIKNSTTNMINSPVKNMVNAPMKNNMNPVIKNMMHNPVANMIPNPQIKPKNFIQNPSQNQENIYQQNFYKQNFYQQIPYQNQYQYQNLNPYPSIVQAPNPMRNLKLNQSPILNPSLVPLGKPKLRQLQQQQQQQQHVMGNTLGSPLSNQFQPGTGAEFPVRSSSITSMLRRLALNDNYSLDEEYKNLRMGENISVPGYMESSPSSGDQEHDEMDNNNFYDASEYYHESEHERWSLRYSAFPAGFDGKLLQNLEDMLDAGDISSGSAEALFTLMEEEEA